jgi:hypothetical protein
MRRRRGGFPSTQMRANAAASAFSPAQSIQRQTSGQQGLWGSQHLTANGQVSLCRRRFAHGQTPIDRLVDEAEATVRMGTRQLCCLLNADAASFARAAENLRPSGGEPSPERRRTFVARPALVFRRSCCVRWWSRKESRCSVRPPLPEIWSDPHDVDRNFSLAFLIRLCNIRSFTAF